eukprot:snap_masked-scaffold_1-processed-gene-31.1-mRNA-1 protein AED:1.00 eAED:1.00 QI:0/0/0/0/1/1/3/0/329
MLEENIVARLTEGEWEFEVDVVFAGNKSQAPPISDPPESVELNEIRGDFVYISYGLFLFIYLCVIICYCFVQKYKHLEIIKAAQPFYLYVLLLGVSITNVSLIFFYKDPTGSQAKNNFSCNAQFYFISFGLTLSIGSLLAKHAEVTNAEKFKSGNKVCGGIAVLALINLLLIYIAYSFDELSYNTIVLETDEFNQVIESYGQCDYSKASRRVYHGRNIPNDFYESNWIAATILSQFQLVTLGVPITIAISPEETSAVYLLLCLLVFLSNMLFIVLIFGPKIYRIATNDTEVKWRSMEQLITREEYVEELDEEGVSIVNESKHSMDTNQF